MNRPWSPADEHWRAIARLHLEHLLKELYHDCPGLSEHKAREILLDRAHADYREHLVDAFMAACREVLDEADRALKADDAVLGKWGRT